MLTGVFRVNFRECLLHYYSVIRIILIVFCVLYISYYWPQLLERDQLPLSHMCSDENTLQKQIDFHRSNRVLAYTVRKCKIYNQQNIHLSYLQHHRRISHGKLLGTTVATLNVPFYSAVPSQISHTAVLQCDLWSCPVPEVLKHTIPQRNSFFLLWKTHEHKHWIEQ